MPTFSGSTKETGDMKEKTKQASAATKAKLGKNKAADTSAKKPEKNTQSVTQTSPSIQEKVRKIEEDALVTAQKRWDETKKQLMDTKPLENKLYDFNNQAQQFKKRDNTTKEKSSCFASFTRFLCCCRGEKNDGTEQEKKPLLRKS